jgi:hypothetical protein
MFYTIFILVLTIIAASRKHTGVWKSSVADAPFFTPGAAHSIPPVTSQPASAPAGSYAQNSAGAGGYSPQPIVHSASASQGGIGPTSVQAGTVHESV